MIPQSVACNIEQYAEAQVEGDVEASIHGTFIHDLRI